MKILVYPHVMEIGGSQLNAVQLAGAVRDLGHEVIVLSEPGPMVAKVRELGLEHLEIPRSRGVPSAMVSNRLARIVQDRRIDVVHGSEWPSVIEAFFGPGLRYRTPVVGTVMSMSVVWFFPRTVPLFVGTQEMHQAAIKTGHRRVMLLEPPVDTEGDDPCVEDGRDFRRRLGIGDDEAMIVMVSRLASTLKLEGLIAACQAVGEIAAGSERRARLVIVGDGPVREQVAAQSAAANAAADRDVVILCGEMADPRPAYASADIVIGMGGSALRGLAFAKPLVVIGEEGFSETLTDDTLGYFLQKGWYGRGPGSLGAGVPALRRALERLIDSPEMRFGLSKMSRQLVIDRFSLRRAARFLEQEYYAAIEDPVATHVRAKDVALTAGGLATRLVWREIIRLSGVSRRQYSGQ
ncbi:glycosyltransferase family 4 protein [Methylobacterium sp. C25]|uniref:glycosyltransferase family 4 protein n=1 Tax=Methylobacterium sp. C25 TaxID=2721622 RepID=UPI001F3D0A42|nr:glycosyltransferase family 4 protein [Methylobacterium sp. C25]MCE4225045.1 glycosyltransferase family 4 protein [Methylobacterium sp. C25]